MRILFSAVPAPGHVLPMLPLADAAAGAGHEVAFVTGADMARYLGAHALLAAGPDDTGPIHAEVARRTGGGDARHAGAAAVELFAGARLLPEVDVVVGAGGSGTLTATLAAGLPTVIRPVLADQPWNAQRAAATGAAIAIEDPAEAGPAVRTVLTDPAYRTAARAAADSIRSMPSADAVLNDLLARTVVSDRA